MKLLKSKRGIPIPDLFFVTDRSKIKEIPKGVPYFYGDPCHKEAMVLILEREVLLQRALRTRLPIDFNRILKSQGFTSVEDFYNIENSKGSDPKIDAKIGSEAEASLKSRANALRSYIASGSVYVDIQVIKDLNIMPTWMISLEDAVSTNIHNFAAFDHNLYNKKLEGMYGGITLKTPRKNLIIVDISGSIPNQVSSTCLTLAKNLSESFYADLMITGSKSTLYEYHELEKLDTERVYEENGTDNDQIYFKKLLTETERDYDNVIVFGDSDRPGLPWINKHNHHSKTVDISIEQGRALCRWSCNKILSFHTKNTEWYRDKGYWKPNDAGLAGYARWFSPKVETKHIGSWVKDLKK